MKNTSIVILQTHSYNTVLFFIISGKQLTDQQISLGNKLLVYISCCLAGRAYPVGDIPTEQVASVKHEVFKCLTCLHSKDAPDSELSYPYLRSVLKLFL